MLDVYYRDEVGRKIAVLEEALHTIDTNGHFDDQIKIILSSCMQIMDLGMIHGYEGVEAIAERMFAAARYCAWHGSEKLDEVRSKLDQSLDTLKQVVEISDSTVARQFVDKTKFEMDFRIDEVVVENDDTETDSLWAEPGRGKINGFLNGDKNLFEIQDLNILPTNGQGNGIRNGNGKIAGDIDENAISEKIGWGYTGDLGDSKDDADEMHVPRHDYMKSFEEGEIELVDDALNTILLNKIDANLGKIETDIEHINLDHDTELAVQDLKEICTELQSDCGNVALQPLADIVYPMAKIARENLPNSATRQEAISVLQDCALLLRDFLTHKKIPLSNISALKRKMTGFELSRNPTEADQIDRLFSFDEEEEMEILPPLKMPLIVRLKRLFGMY